MESRLVHNRLPERQRHYEGDLVYWSRSACKESWLQDDSFPMPLGRARLGWLQSRALDAYSKNSSLLLNGFTVKLEAESVS